MGGYKQFIIDMLHYMFHSSPFFNSDIGTYIPFFTESVFGPLLGISALIPGSAYLQQKQVAKIIPNIKY